MNQLPTASEALTAWKTVLLFINANDLKKGYMENTVRAISNTLSERAIVEQVDPATFTASKE